jgi:hypothetical protein
MAARRQQQQQEQQQPHLPRGLVAAQLVQPQGWVSVLPPSWLLELLEEPYPRLQLLLLLLLQEKQQVLQQQQQQQQVLQQQQQQQAMVLLLLLLKLALCPTLQALMMCR